MSTSHVNIAWPDGISRWWFDLGQPDGASQLESVFSSLAVRRNKENPKADEKHLMIMKNTKWFGKEVGGCAELLRPSLILKASGEILFVVFSKPQVTNCLNLKSQLGALSKINETKRNWNFRREEEQTSGCVTDPTRQKWEEENNTYVMSTRRSFSFISHESQNDRWFEFSFQFFQSQASHVENSF